MNNLYYVENVGCDDTTIGLVRISDEYFPQFKEFIENLNKNSTYGCMPTIDVFKITEDMLRPATDDDYKSDKMYLDGAAYVFKESVGYKEKTKEQVI